MYRVYRWNILGHDSVRRINNAVSPCQPRFLGIQATKCPGLGTRDLGLIFQRRHELPSDSFKHTIGYKVSSK